jgi:hypothetical protein
MQITWRTLTTTWLLVIFLLLPALGRAETQVVAWYKRFGSPAPATDGANAAAADSSSNVIVTGVFNSRSYGTIKYSSAGVPLWTNYWNDLTDRPANVCRIAVDSGNNVFVTGYSVGTGDSSDFATIKYSSAGEAVWTNYYNGPANGTDRGWALATDGSGNLTVSGWSSDSAGKGDYATIKYTGDGMPLWTNRYNGTGNGDDYVSKVATDRDGNVIVTGYSYGGVSGDDYATIKYSSEGVPLWTNRYSRSPGYSSDQTRDLAVDSRGNAIVTGMTAIGYTTIKHSSAGVPLWTNEWQAHMPTSVVVDANETT